MARYRVTIIALIFGAIFAAIALPHNHELFKCLNCGNNALLNTIMMTTTMAADGFFVLMVFSILAPMREKILTPAFLAILLSAIITQILKSYFDMPRPPAVFSPDEICVLGIPFSTRSFPSGHTTVAFALGRYIFESKNQWVKLVGILFPVMAGISRVFLGVHFPIDVIAGGLIGWVTSELMIQFFPYTFLNKKYNITFNIIGILSGVGFLFFYKEGIKEVEFITRPAAIAFIIFFSYRLIKFVFMKSKYAR